MFPRLSTTIKFPELEERVLRLWKDRGIDQKGMTFRQGRPSYVFFEGPPTANGLPGVHHVLARAYKDIMPRYMTMRGFFVPRKAGWDTHGLPVELEVEKALGLNSKRDIEEYGIARFNEKCKESVFRYEAEWRKLTERIGFWLDLDHPYITFTDDYIESIWWILRQIWDKGLMYQGHKVVPYCPRCGTPLSSHEVALGYETTRDPSLYVRMRITGRPGVAFLVWTTTPWTLPSNVALAVHPEAAYAHVRHGKEELILAKDLLEFALTGPYTVLQEMRGRDLVGWEYEPLFDFFKGKTDRRAWYVIPGEFVTTEEGTGIVHLAPAYGEDDMEMSRQYDLPVFHPVDLTGRYSAEVPPWHGLFVKEADPKITADLKQRGLLYRETTYEHTYPFCWRCDTPLLYYAKTSWFIRVTALRDQLLATNEQINWIPEHIKSGRYGNWLENVVDWALSRDRYWGTPLPVWTCEGCGHQHCVGGIAELREMAVRLPAHFELHKPYVDDMILRCPRCGGEMQRGPEVIDVWFDSGAMPVAQWHYPFENQEEFKRSIPGDFISEGIDQTRGWFYSLHAIAVLLFGSVCYRNCVCLELVLDAQGQKMSKSRGNVLNPWSIINEQGADALRWYFFAVSPPGIPKRLGPEMVTEVLRRFLLTLWNVHVFFTTYARLDGFDPQAVPAVAPRERALLDRWVLSRLRGLVRDATAAMEAYDVTTAAREIERFTDDLSNWYVRRGRRRYWKTENDRDKQSAYHTLYEVLVTLSKLMAPFTPFLAEALYQDLVRSVDGQAPESVHLCDWPEADALLVDAGLEDAMEAARRLVTLGRNVRMRRTLKVRQPLAEALLVTRDPALPRLKELLGHIADELNVKSVRVVADAGTYLSQELRPRFDRLGPRLGGRLPDVVNALKAQSAQALSGKFTAEGEVTLDLPDGTVTVSAEEVEIRTVEKPGFAAAIEGNEAIVLDTRLTPELAREGMARELVHQVQQLRKESGLDIADRIRLFCQGPAAVEEVVRGFQAYIAQETLAVEVQTGKGEAMTSKRLKLDGHEVVLGLVRV
ncbi:MAG: isoleucine--tRNA ligase [Armatimonadetes bacterium]|nr:isoleucine--tRNA ligase [Armatimonadota bacterium]